LYFVQFWVFAYRDKKVVGVFVRFRVPLHQNQMQYIVMMITKAGSVQQLQPLISKPVLSIIYKPSF
jgi:hypothetical protein